ncbi:MAG: deoxyribodipyrimidine photolyase [Planctomycetes bacterium]|jgi:deoxyribodipyrimidine photo-lyase|nr:deoxyribodipyrimidine photo-lyase [Phycisphaerae bacterium]NBB96307.1 deoxyribodipyrimidine photolyase [Planctomycetota bacterium]
MIHEERIQPLNGHEPVDGDYVLYWMQASHRAEHNDALDYAIDRANELSVPVVCGFGLTDDYPQANVRHYAFMLEGLAETARTLADRGVRLVVRHGSPPQVACELAGAAAMVVCDRGYLRHQEAWRQRVAELDRRVVQVETDAVVPVEVLSDHEEYAARTLRPKHRKLWDEYLRLNNSPPLAKRDSLAIDLGGLDMGDPDARLAELDVDRDVPRSVQYRGGLAEARRRLGDFVAQRLKDYDALRSDPSLDIESGMSPYLHFGQISPIEVAKTVAADARHGRDNIDSYLEELLIRRELAFNVVRFNADYDRYICLPDWARATLKKHRDDPREHVYTKAQLEAADTHDPYWNAAMREMVLTGKMHNYMRMYWGKKVLEWTTVPQTAYRWLLELNNRYFIDGRDPASYGNVAWIFGKHDRPWRERDVFGTVRYMSAGGLERKFDIDAYVRQIDQLDSER